MEDSDEDEGEESVGEYLFRNFDLEMQPERLKPNTFRRRHRLP
jgi:hypothetical protein